MDLEHLSARVRFLRDTHVEARDLPLFFCRFIPTTKNIFAEKNTKMSKDIIVMKINEQT